jgi:hypothetical protein
MPYLQKHQVTVEGCRKALGSRVEIWGDQSVPHQADGVAGGQGITPGKESCSALASARRPARSSCASRTQSLRDPVTNRDPSSEGDRSQHREPWPPGVSAKRSVMCCTSMISLYATASDKPVRAGSNLGKPSQHGISYAHADCGLLHFCPKRPQGGTTGTGRLCAHGTGASSRAGTDRSCDSR